MATMIHQLKVEVWIREQIAQMGEQEFLESLHRALERYQQTGEIEPQEPHNREWRQHTRRAA
jgi:hypothetical protein